MIQIKCYVMKSNLQVLQVELPMLQMLQLMLLSARGKARVYTMLRQPRFQVPTWQLPAAVALKVVAVGT